MNKKTKNTYCHKCKTKTNQKIIFQETELDTKEVFFKSLKGDARWIVEERIWTITRCAGCEVMNMEILTQHIGNENSFVEQIPRRAVRIPPSWIFKLMDKNYFELLLEIYSAFNQKNLRLTTMGMRTFIDLLLTQSIGSDGTFSERVNKFVHKEGMSIKQKNLLNSIIEVGNAAAHRGYEPSLQTLNDLLDMIESINLLDILESKSKAIYQKTPKRMVVKS